MHRRLLLRTAWCGRRLTSRRARTPGPFRAKRTRLATRGRRLRAASRASRSTCRVSSQGTSSFVAEVQDIGDDNQNDDEQVPDKLRSHATESLEILGIRIGPSVLVDDELFVLGGTLDCAEQPRELIRNVRIEKRRLNAGATRNDTQIGKWRYGILHPLLGSGGAA